MRKRYCAAGAKTHCTSLAERCLPTLQHSCRFSTGGQLSAYHRLTAPEVFDAAVAASADIMYVLGTKMWLDYSNRYHQIIAAAVKANSKGTPCFDIVRSGLLYVRELIRTRAGRKRLGDVFQLCRDDKAQVVDDEANGISLLNSLYDQWLGLVQVISMYFPPLLALAVPFCCAREWWHQSFPVLPILLLPRAADQLPACSTERCRDGLQRSCGCSTRCVRLRAFGS